MHNRNLTTTRGISTVLDVTLCLLLISAAAGVLVTGMETQTDTDKRADTAAELVGTSTASILYAEDHQTGQNRTDYGTIAGLLGQAAVMNATIDDEPIAPVPGYQQAVDGATENVRPMIPGRVQLQAHWRPLQNGPIEGTVTVGQSPPPGRTVHTATMTVPRAAPVDRDNQTAVASWVINQLFPPTRVGPVMNSSDAKRTVAAERYRLASTTLGVDPETVVTAPPPQANKRLAAALAQRLNETGADSGELNPDVRIIVRVWER